MTKVWRVRLLSLAGSVLVVEAIMVIGGMGPRLMLVTLLAIAAAAVGWLAVDLGGAVEPVMWRTLARSPTAAAGADARSQLMRMRLVRTISNEQTLHDLHISLVALIDDRLLSVHLVDRNHDPDAARAILGTELSGVVNGPPSPVTLSEPSYLAHVVTLIENV